MQPSVRERLLLRAALDSDGGRAASAWTQWQSQIAMEVAPYSELRLLPATYANLARQAPETALPPKLRGKAKATFTQNMLHARDALQFMEALAPNHPVVVTKGLAICARYDAWSVRPMGDADLVIPFGSMRAVCEIMRDLGWQPKNGLTWSSLVKRCAERRASWGVTKGRADIDLHWRVTDGPGEHVLAEEMWAGTRSRDLLGRSVLVPSPELAATLSLRHGFQSGTHADGLQTMLDCAQLLPDCEQNRLARLLSAAGLMPSFQRPLSLLAEVGATVEIGALLQADQQHGDLDRTAWAPVVATPSPRAPRQPREADKDRGVLRYPRLYRVWTRLGRSALLERLLIRTLGPMSKPPLESKLPRPAYDLSQYDILDEIGGPGWGSPEINSTCIWSDSADARLLVPVDRRTDYIVEISFSTLRWRTAAPKFHVFANGHHVRTIDFRIDRAASTSLICVPKHCLRSGWVELSFRSVGARDDDTDLRFQRSLPIVKLATLRVEDQLRERIVDEGGTKLYEQILKGEEPMKGKFDRIVQKINESPKKNDARLPEGFDPIGYVLSHPDVFSAEADPYRHFLRHGMREGRTWHR